MIITHCNCIMDKERVVVAHCLYTGSMSSIPQF